MDGILVPLSPGELYDKISILEIKSEKISDAEKLSNVRHELALLCDRRDDLIGPDQKLDELYAQLKAVNLELWDIEDDIRDCERDDDFGETFVKLARAVYFTNDRRAAIKKEINIFLGSRIVEEKSYAAY